jgi:hypothetical protein
MYDLLPYLFLVAITQGIFLLCPQEFLMKGFLLIVWGFFTLARMLQLLVFDHNIKDIHEQNLPGKLLSGLNYFLFVSKENDLNFLSKNTLLAFFILGICYYISANAPCILQNSLQICYPFALSSFVSCAITGLSFWVIQSYSLRVKKACVLITYAAASSLGLFAWLLFSHEVSLMDNWNVIGDFNIFHNRHISEIFLLFIIFLCAGVYIQAIIKRRRNKGFAIAGIGLAVFLVVIEIFYEHSDYVPLDAVQLGCWSGMGAAWVQSWPGYKIKRSRRYKHTEYLLTEEQK